MRGSGGVVASDIREDALGEILGRGAADARGGVAITAQKRTISRKLRSIFISYTQKTELKLLKSSQFLRRCFGHKTSYGQ